MRTSAFGAVTSLFPASICNRVDFPARGCIETKEILGETAHAEPPLAPTRIVRDPGGKEIDTSCRAGVKDEGLCEKVKFETVMEWFPGLRMVDMSRRVRRGNCVKGDNHQVFPFLSSCNPHGYRQRWQRLAQRC